MNFDKAFARLLDNEGGYSNNASDPGGRTNWGITEAVARANGYTGDMRDMTQDFAKHIYRSVYWDSVGIVNLPDAVQFDVFDGAVNSGPSQSVKWLQRAAGVPDDGVIGHMTITACSLIPGYVLAARYNGQRLMFMTNLKPTVWDAFGKGWTRRIAKNLMET